MAHLHDAGTSTDIVETELKELNLRECTQVGGKHIRNGMHQVYTSRASGIMGMHI